MKTGVAGTIAPIIVLAAMAGVAPCLGQDLNIEIPVPEPGSHSPAAKEGGKRKLAHRGAEAAESRRAARPATADPRPALGTSLGEEPPADLGPLPDRAETPSAGVKSPRGRPELPIDSPSRHEPSWENPARIPSWGKPLSEPGAASSGREKPAAAKGPARAARNHPDSKESAARSAWLSRWFQPGRREGAPAEPPQVARRHRTSAQGASKDLAPPFSARPRLPTPLDLDSLAKPYRD